MNASGEIIRKQVVGAEGGIRAVAFSARSDRCETTRLRKNVWSSLRSVPVRTPTCVRSECFVRERTVVRMVTTRLGAADANQIDGVIPPNRFPPRLTQHLLELGDLLISGGRIRRLTIVGGTVPRSADRPHHQADRVDASTGATPPPGPDDVEARRRSTTRSDGVDGAAMRALQVEAQNAREDVTAHQGAVRHRDFSESWSETSAAEARTLREHGAPSCCQREVAWRSCGDETSALRPS